MVLKPWREVVVPHDDVLSGTFVQAEFAADLTQVAQGKAQLEYQNPALFFQRTFITEGMRLLLTSVAKRLAGQGGDPVIQLQTAFGGGKTHTMLAVYHMVSGDIPATSLMGLDKILSSAGISQLPKARISVLDGVAMAPNQPKMVDGVRLHTIWGRLAWDLGGVDGYSMLADADQSGTSPGKEVLVDLLSKYAPCVVLIDELVAYFRQFEEGKQFTGGTFDSNLSFIQALTEAIKLVPTAVLLASLPESEKEVGDRRGQKSLAVLAHAFGRIQALWKPVGTEEAFEIVRRRLFGLIKDDQAKDEVCDAYYQMYRTRAAHFPDTVQETRYLERLKNSYPIHPEFFDRLYEDWAALDNFQRTRGVLKLMAKVIYQLWQSNNQDSLVMPGNLPLGNDDVQNEMAYYLPNGWHSVIDADMDGSLSVANALDMQEARFGSVSACKRLARAIFLGSAPGALKDGNKGMEKSRVLLSVVTPAGTGQIGIYEDALKRICNKLHYLGYSNDRYWFGTVPNLRREMEARRDKVVLDLVLPVLENQLTKDFSRGDFDGVHVFPATSDVMDDERLRLVILVPQNHYSKNDPSATALTAAESFLDKRGLVPRINKNRLLFLACDSMSKEQLLKVTKEFVAWKSIVDEAKSGLLNLNMNQLKEAERSQESSKETVRRTLSVSYKWILAPYKDFDKKTLSDVKWDVLTVPNGFSSPADAVIEVLTENESLLTQWAALHLSTEMEKWFWKDGDTYRAVDLWRHFSQQLYLPRLKNVDVLRATIENGSGYRDYWGVAQGRVDDDFSGFSFGKTANIIIDENLLLIKPNLALAYEKKLEEKFKPGPVVVPKPVPGNVNADQDEPPIEKNETPHRLYASYELDAKSPGRSLSKIIDAILDPVRYGDDVKVTLSVEIDISKLKGFTKEEIRAIKENCNTYRLNIPEFDDHR